MSEKTDIVEGEQSPKETVTENGQGTPPVKTEEVLKLEAKKAELEEQIKGLEGTADSIKEDIVRKRQERKEVADEEQQPVFDKEALLAEFEEKQKEILDAKLKPVLEENEKLQKAVLKTTEEALKAKKQALDSINARMASASGSSGPSSPDSQVENEVELSDDEKKVMGDLGIKDPRYLKDTEVRGL